MCNDCRRHSNLPVEPLVQELDSPDRSPILNTIRPSLLMNETAEFDKEAYGHDNQDFDEDVDEDIEGNIDENNDEGIDEDVEDFCERTVRPFELPKVPENASHGMAGVQLPHPQQNNALLAREKRTIERSGNELPASERSVAPNSALSKVQPSVEGVLTGQQPQSAVLQDMLGDGQPYFRPNEFSKPYSMQSGDTPEDRYSLISL
jgi:hypothetical protein